jgi:hypothetical protein
MKVYIGPYKSWLGPHQLAEIICFWVKDVNHKDNAGYEYKDKPEWVFKFGEWLAYGKWRGVNDISLDGKNIFKERNENETWLFKFLQWVEHKRKRSIYVKIDKWDTWSMDSTLAIIILPMLIQLKQTKHGSPTVDMEDVPEELRCTNTEDYDSQQTFTFYSKYDLEEGTGDVHARWDWVLNEIIWAFEQLNNDNDDDLLFYNCGEWDSEGYNKHNNRINNGLRLFGKYYRGLWD